MRRQKESILKRWHTLSISPHKCRDEWQPPYWQSTGEYQDIACRDCRKFDPAKSLCSVNFGTPLRKCAVASIEAHFHNCKGQDCLEIGFGRFKLAKALIIRSGGSWTGIDPAQPGDRKAVKGRGGYGTAARIPFDDASFDRVFGIQSFEHWGQKAAPGRDPSDYGDCLDEIHRVLKPGGTIYLDAPIHFHGHEMFIMGDVPRIRSLFETGHWQDVQIQRWRQEYDPLEHYPPNSTVLREWPIEISSYPNERIEQAKQGSVWLLTVTARKQN